MNNSYSRLALSLGLGLGLSISAQALTINGGAKNRNITACFDLTSIAKAVGGYGEELDKRINVAKQEILNSWGHNTMIQFTFVEESTCNSNHTIIYKARDKPSDNASFGGNVIKAAFNSERDHFKYYEIQSSIVHETGHFLGFPHEHLRADSNFKGESSNQQFRLYNNYDSSFSIHSDVNTSLCLEVAEAGKKVTQQICRNNNRQKFSFKDGASAKYSRIENKYNGKCLDINEGGVNNGDALIQWSCHNGDNQLFSKKKYSYKNVSEDIMTLEVKHSLKCLDIPQGSAIAGIQPIQYDCKYKKRDNYRYLTPSYDKFSVMSYENGGLRKNDFLLSSGDISGSKKAYGDSGKSVMTESIISASSGKCVEYKNNKLVQYTCNSNNTQQFRAIMLADNEFSITLRKDSNKCVTENSGKLIFSECSKDFKKSQRFSLDNNKQKPSYSAIKSLSSGKCLDIAWGSKSNGANVILWECHNGDNQKFSIKKN